jgi:ribosomal protein L20
VLADLAVRDKPAFAAIVEQVRGHVAQAPGQAAA